jgi:hypothetical protein
MINAEWILRIVIFGIVHWLLVGLLLPDLVSNKNVLGGHKAPWAIIMIIIPCFGSLLYLLVHPHIIRARGDNLR